MAFSNINISISFKHQVSAGLYFPLCERSNRVWHCPVCPRYTQMKPLTLCENSSFSVSGWSFSHSPSKPVLRALFLVDWYFDSTESVCCVQTEVNPWSGLTAGVCRATGESTPSSVQSQQSLLLLLVVPEPKELVGDFLKDVVDDDNDGDGGAGNSPGCWGLDLLGLPSSSSLASQSME